MAGALGIVTGVRDSEQADAALKRTTAELGPVTILVNNAGGAFFSPLLDTTENGWDALVRAAPGYAAYAAAKAGVGNYTKTAAFESATHGIRVNALAPDISAAEGLVRLGADA